MTAECTVCQSWRALPLHDESTLPATGLECLMIHIDFVETRLRVDRGPYVITEYYDADSLDLVRDALARSTGFRIWQSTLDLHLVVKMAEAFMTDQLGMPAAVRIERDDLTIFAASWPVARLNESGERVTSPLSVPLY